MELDSDDEPLHPYNPPEHAFTTFNYQDPCITCNLSKAIFQDDLEHARCLIQTGQLNSQDNNGDVPLHVAVMVNSGEILELLLRQPDINVNHQNYVGNTPLILSLLLRREDAFIRCLIEAGSDVNIRNNMEETALHVALSKSSNEIAHELIKRGADINAQDANEYTPLHIAVQNDNLAAVHMLLYYGADANKQCIHSLTPFMYAVNDSNRLEMSKVLMNYCDDFSVTTCDGFTALLLAANSVNDIAVDLVKAGADVNYLTPEGEHSMFFALHFETSELFKAIWCRLDHSSLLYCRIPFLTTFITRCRYWTVEEWIQCLYLILDSPAINRLIQHSVDRINQLCRKGLFWTIINALYEQLVKLKDRIPIIYSFLSLGVQVNADVLNLVHEFYGLNEEFEAFVHCGHACYETVGKDDNIYFPVTAFILGLEEACSVELIVKLFKNQVAYCNTAQNPVVAKSHILDSFGFFSLPYTAKIELLNFHALHQDIAGEIQAKLSAVPEHPSLLELSRNKARTFIKQVYKTKKPYQFHNAVKNLRIPDTIKDLILFKKPLYH